MFKELHPTDEPPDIFYSPVDETPFHQATDPHVEHESDGWVDTDDVGEGERSQEIEFPHTGGEKEVPLLLASPPARRTLDPGPREDDLNNGVTGTS